MYLCTLGTSEPAKPCRLSRYSQTTPWGCHGHVPRPHIYPIPVYSYPPPPPSAAKLKTRRRHAILEFEWERRAKAPELTGVLSIRVARIGKIERACVGPTLPRATCNTTSEYPDIRQILGSQVMKSGYLSKRKGKRGKLQSGQYGYSKCTHTHESLTRMENFLKNRVFLWISWYSKFCLYRTGTVLVRIAQNRKKSLDFVSSWGCLPYPLLAPPPPSPRVE